MFPSNKRISWVIGPNHYASQPNNLWTSFPVNLVHILSLLPLLLTVLSWGLSRVSLYPPVLFSVQQQLRPVRLSDDSAGCPNKTIGKQHAKKTASMIYVYLNHYVPYTLINRLARFSPFFYLYIIKSITHIINMKGVKMTKIQSQLHWLQRMVWPIYEYTQ